MALDREFEFFKKNKEALLAEYEDKFVVIVADKVVGAFNDKIEAIESARKNHQPGTFFVKQVCRKEEPIFFHSRVFSLAK